MNTPAPVGGPSPLRDRGMTWAAAGVLPLPVLVASDDPSAAAPVACLYLGLASAWLAAEVVRAGGWPASRARWRAKQLAVAAGVLVNTSLFVAMGLAAGVRTNIPFPLMAALCATPAVGLVPWLAVKVGNGYGAILLAAVMLLAAKLAACVAARIVYGPDCIQAGYVAGDWRTAKLMISLFWVQAVAMSVAGAAAGWLGARADRDPDDGAAGALAGKPPVAPLGSTGVFGRCVAIRRRCWGLPVARAPCAQVGPGVRDGGGGEQCRDEHVGAVKRLERGAVEDALGGGVEQAVDPRVKDEKPACSAASASHVARRTVVAARADGWRRRR